MSVVIQGDSISATNILSGGVKLNVTEYVITVEADDQVIFNIPFQYVDGNPIYLDINRMKYEKDLDFTVDLTLNQITLRGTIPALDELETFKIYG